MRLPSSVVRSIESFVASHPLPFLAVTPQPDAVARERHANDARHALDAWLQQLVEMIADTHPSCDPLESDALYYEWGRIGRSPYHRSITALAQRYCDASGRVVAQYQWDVLRVYDSTSPLIPVLYAPQPVERPLYEGEEFLPVQGQTPPRWHVEPAPRQRPWVRWWKRIEHWWLRSQLGRL